MRVTEAFRECGATAEVHRVGDVYDVKCSACGTAYAYHANPVRPPLSPEDLAPSEVHVQWRNGRPTHPELKVLQKLFPALAERPIAALYAGAKDQPVWLIGVEGLAFAKRLQAEALLLGVALEVGAAHV